MYRGTSDFNKSYQPTTNIEMDENGEWFVDSYSILLVVGTISPSY